MTLLQFNSLWLPFLIWTDQQPGEELNGEKYDNNVVNEVDDEHDAGEVDSPLLVLLKLLCCRDDESEGRNHHLV